MPPSSLCSHGGILPTSPASDAARIPSYVMGTWLEPMFVSLNARRFVACTNRLSVCNTKCEGNNVHPGVMQHELGGDGKHP